MDNEILVTQSEELKKEISSSINFWFGLHQTNNPASTNQLKSQLNDRKSTQYKNIYNEIYSDINKVYSINSIGKAIEGYSSKYEKNFKTFNNKLSEFSSITADKIIGIIGTGLQGSFNPQKITEAVQKLITERENEFEEYFQKNGGQLENYMILLKGAGDGDVDYKYISESAGACDLCDGLNEQSFKMINAKAGINYPPIHPNCKCRVEALKFGSIIGYSRQPEDIVNNLNKLLDNLPYIDKDVERIEQINNDEDTLPTLTHPDYYTEYGPFYEYPWVKTTPLTEPTTKEEDYGIEPFMKIPLEERTKWPYQGYEKPIIVTDNGVQYEVNRNILRNTYFGNNRPVLEDLDFVEFLFFLGMADDERALRAKDFSIVNGNLSLDGFGLIGILIWESGAGKNSNNLFGQNPVYLDIKYLSNGISVPSIIGTVNTEGAYNRAVKALKGMGKSDEEIYILMTTPYNEGIWGSAYLQTSLVYETTINTINNGDNMIDNYESLPEARDEADYWRNVILN